MIFDEMLTFQWLAKGCNFKHIQAGTQQEIAKGDWLLFKRCIAGHSLIVRLASTVLKKVIGVI